MWWGDRLDEMAGLRGTPSRTGRIIGYVLVVALVLVGVSVVALSLYFRGTYWTVLTVVLVAGAVLGPIMWARHRHRR